MYTFFLGQTLSKVLEDCESVLESNMKLKHMSTFSSLKFMTHALHGLMDREYSETMALLVQVPRDIDSRTNVSIFEYLRCFWRLMLSLVMCDYKQAYLEACNVQRLDKNPIHGMALCVIFTFDSLARLTVCSPRGLNRLSTIAIVRKPISVLQKMSNVNPKQCLGMLQLVQAK
jgi:hypothetical protein